MKYCRELKFEEDPDYDYLISLLKKIITDNTNSSNPDYDWNDKLKSTTEYEVNKNGYVNKKQNISMALNHKSTNSPYEGGIDDTGISGNKKDLDKNSIFQKEEEKYLF